MPFDTEMDSKYDTSSWKEFEIVLESHGKAPKKLGEGVFKFYAAMTLEIIMPRRGWTVVKKTKNYIFLKPPEGIRPPFSVRLKLPSEEQAIKIAEDSYEEGQSWMGQLGELPAFYRHKDRFETGSRMIDENTLDTKVIFKKSATETSRFWIGQFDLWETVVTKENDGAYKFRESGKKISNVETLSQELDLRAEGATYTIELTRYERDRISREKCIEHYGSVCKACGFDFEKVYGILGKGYIQVHHIVPLSHIKEEYQVDFIKDLIPLCANCHAMVHMKNPPVEVEKLRSVINETKSKKG